VATLIATERLRRGSAASQVAALVLGTAVRLLVGFGGAVLVFVLSKPTFHVDALGFWMWVLGVYLATLVVETALLARVPSGPATAVQTGSSESA
jgi:hypothetical protein